MNRTRAFFCGLGVVLLFGVGLRLALAAEEWFISDDFFFLAQVQDPSWSLREALLPTHPRLIAAYRPVGLDAYFLLNFELFGFHAFGYYLTALLLQLGTALAIARIALGYGIERRAAWIAAASVLLAAPSTLASYAVAEHNYICAALCYSLCLALLLEELARPRPWLRWASYAVLTLGLLSNEVCMTFPGVALLAAYLSSQGDLRRASLAALRVSWPYAALAALFLDFKLTGVPMHQENWFYEVDLGTDMLGNLFGNLAHVHGGYAALVVVAALGMLLVSMRARASGARLHAGQRRAALVGAAWLLATALPFTVLALPASRFALLQLPAAALLWAVLLDAALPYLRPAWQTPALLAALVLLTPWTRMLELRAAPHGSAFRDAYQVLARELPNSPSLCVHVDCDAPGLASKQQCAAFRGGTFGGALMRAVAPNRRVDVDFSDHPSPSSAEGELPCQRFYLTPELALTTEPPHALHVSTLR